MQKQSKKAILDHKRCNGLCQLQSDQKLDQKKIKFENQVYNLSDEIASYATKGVAIY